MISKSRLAKKGGRRGTSSTVVTKVVATRTGVKARKLRVERPLAQSSDQMARYHAALHSPFSPEAMGCRVPDAYSYPTATFRINGKTSLNSTGAGAINMAFFNNPLVSVIDFNTYTSTWPVSFTPNPSFWAYTTPAALSAVMGSFRVVSWGLQIRNVLPTTAAAGLLTIVPYPTVGIIPGPNILSSQPLDASRVFTKATGLSMGGSILPSSILGLPRAVSLTSQDMISDRLTVRGIPTTTASENFHNAGDYAALYGNTWSAEDTTGFTGGAAPVLGNYFDNASSMNLDGWSCFMLVASGLPINTACFEIEWVIHLEGPPAVLTSSTVVASAPIISHVNPSGYLREVAKATVNPLITLATGLASSYGGPVGGAIAGGLGKLIMAKLGLSM